MNRVERENRGIWSTGPTAILSPGVSDGKSLLGRTERGQSAQETPSQDWSREFGLPSGGAHTGLLGRRLLGCRAAQPGFSWLCMQLPEFSSAGLVLVYQLRAEMSGQACSFTT